MPAARESLPFNSRPDISSRLSLRAEPLPGGWTTVRGEESIRIQARAITTGVRVSVKRYSARSIASYPQCFTTVVNSRLSFQRNPAIPMTGIHTITFPQRPF